jgi:hypothetical protein
MHIGNFYCINLGILALSTQSVNIIEFFFICKNVIDVSLSKRVRIKHTCIHMSENNLEWKYVLTLSRYIVNLCVKLLIKKQKHYGHSKNGTFIWQCTSLCIFNYITKYVLDMSTHSVNIIVFSSFIRKLQKFLY